MLEMLNRLIDVIDVANREMSNEIGLNNNLSVSIKSKKSSINYIGIKKKCEFFLSFIKTYLLPNCKSNDYISGIKKVQQ